MINTDSRSAQYQVLPHLLQRLEPIPFQYGCISNGSSFLAYAYSSSRLTRLRTYSVPVFFVLPFGAEPSGNRVAYNRYGRTHQDYVPIRQQRRAASSREHAAPADGKDNFVKGGGGLFARKIHKFEI